MERTGSDLWGHRLLGVLLAGMLKVTEIKITLSLLGNGILQQVELLIGVLELPFFLNFRGEGREKERERNIDWLPIAHPQVVTWPATQACALTRN